MSVSDVGKVWGQRIQKKMSLHAETEHSTAYNNGCCGIGHPQGGCCGIQFRMLRHPKVDRLVAWMLQPELCKITI